MVCKDKRIDIVFFRSLIGIFDDKRFFETKRFFENDKKWLDHLSHKIFILWLIYSMNPNKQFIIDFF